MSNSNLEMRKIKSLNFLYEVNENGTIFRNVKSKKQLKIQLDKHHAKDGYYVVFVRVGRRSKKIKRVMIHRVVAECWLGDIPEGYEVDHIDRNSRNNDYRNLRYVTRSEQMKNRDYTRIAAQGTINLAIARQQRMIPVTTTKIGSNERRTFESIADCARYLANVYDKTFEQVRYKLKARRSYIYGHKISYRIAETKRDGFTEQEIVHGYVI